MNIFSKFVIKFRVAIIVVTILITLILGYFVKGIKINPDILSYLPKNDPVAKTFNYIGEEYGGNSIAMVAIETEDVFNKDTIEQINYLTQKFKLVDGVSYVTSLTNVIDIKKDEYNGIEIGRLIDEYDLPKSDAKLQELKKYTLSKDLYRGKLVSEDARAALIMCRIRADVDRIKTAQKLKEIVNNAQVKEKVYYGGLPFQMYDLNNIIVDDLKTLLPLVTILIIISLYIGLRNIRGVVLPLVSVFISIIWTLGIMSLLKVNITVISNIIPVILIAVGSAYGIHVVYKFSESAPETLDKLTRSRDALSEVGIPVMLAGVTTVAGFLSFIFGSYLSMIREFGIFAALGIFFALLVSLTFVPAVLSLLSGKNKTTPTNGTPARKDRFALFMDKIGDWILTHDKAIILSGIIIVIITILGIPRIERKVNMLDYFKPNTSIRLTEELMQREFGGSMPVQILVKGDLQDPKVLSEMKKMEDYLESLGDVHNPQSVVDLIEEISDVMGEGKTIPDSKEKVANLWFLLEGEEIMSQLVKPDKDEGLIQATIINIDTKRMQEVVNNINNYIQKTGNANFTFTQTGLPAIYKRLDESIVNSQIQSLVIAVVLVFICLVFMLHSLVLALIGLIPIVFTLLMIFGFMGFSGIPLDIATVLVGGIAIGIGIDYSIHFMSRFQEESKKSNNKNVTEILNRTLETTGKAIIINVVTVMLGFLVLTGANLVPLQRFGSLVAITMIGSGVGAITLLPAVILSSKIYSKLSRRGEVPKNK